MTYRHQILRNLRYGTLPAFLKLQQEKNELYTAEGLTPYRVWAPAFGGLHHLVLEAEFPTMSDFERQHATAKTITRVAEINAAQLEHVIEGTAEDRLQRLGLDA
ncbi:hypothetical protein Aple_094370 [Acrocarpospora pleiomorpha]|uniref:NIPSNAP domain-containing protein n=1 Tax=Acrocarpospora pleiomorpha TaxID=90975 RepID=A0A5M3Y5N3_9ACTN|nr:hypothetical protein [Acrocarpospora pleiomorpha]GES26538.1 hypothetical protein Aple_094370 [Acrocarpospora pleiomorpha]